MPTPSSQKIQEIAASERPQERLERLGPQALSDIELLAMILRSGSHGSNVLSVATRLIEEAGSLNRLIAWSDKEFAAIKGIGKVKSLQLISVLEICRRVLAAQQDAPLSCETPEAVYQHLMPRAFGQEVEKFWVLSLNRKNRLIHTSEVTSGTASNSLVHPREVFKEAIRHGASAVICAHNHPSGDPSPSAADIKVTRQLKESAAILNIDLLDHVIIGSASGDPRKLGYYSFQEAGML